MKYRTHLFVPDTQVRPGVKTDHIEAAGNYIIEKQPDVIVVAGDWWDCPSLSAWDSAAKKVKEKRVYLSDGDSEGDIEAGNRAMDDFMDPIHQHNRGRKKKYEPALHFAMGNHEYRINRLIEEHPYLGAAVSLDHFNLVYHGFKIHPFLKPFTIDGITYCHYFCRNSKGTVTNSRNGQASAMAQVKNEGMSCTAGHKQGLDTHNQPTVNKRRRGIIAGSFYQHDEDYMGNGHQGQNHWRGMLMKHEVRAGDYDLMEVSINFLLRRYL